MSIMPARLLPKRSVTANCLGFRRVERVSVVLADNGTYAEVTGVGHRLPRTTRMPMRLATALVRDGARLDIVDLRTRGGVGASEA